MAAAQNRSAGRPVRGGTLAATMTFLLVALSMAPATARATKSTTDLISYGTSTAADFVVRVVFKPVAGGPDVRCSGTLVDPSWVLTSASCLKPLGRPGNFSNRFSVIIGATAQNPAGTTVPVVKAAVPPRYNKATRFGGIMMLKLATPSTASTISFLSNLNITQSTKFLVGGYGATQNNTKNALLFTGGTDFLGINTCRTLHKNLFKNKTMPLDHYCFGTGASQSKSSICAGDNGGPYVVVGRDSATNATVVVQFAVASFKAPGACGKEKQVVHFGVGLSFWAKWIRATIRRG